MTKVHLSKPQSQEWRTPKSFIARLKACIPFTLDLCADADNTILDRYFSKKHSFFDVPPQMLRNEVMFCNPPYLMEEITPIVHKCVDFARHGAHVWMLVPLKTDQPWFSLLNRECAAFITMEGRMKFERDPRLPPEINEKTGKPKTFGSPPMGVGMFHLSGNPTRRMLTLSELDNGSNRWDK